MLGDIYKYKINNELCDNATSTVVSSVIGKLIAHSGELGSIKCARETLGLKSIPLEDAMDERDIEVLEYLIGDYHVTPDERPYDDTMNMAIREDGLPIVRLLKNHGYGIVDRDCNLLEAVKCISDIKLRDYLVENWSKLAVKVPYGYMPHM